MSAERFDEWQAFCEPLGWNESRGRRASRGADLLQRARRDRRAGQAGFRGGPRPRRLAAEDGRHRRAGTRGRPRRGAAAGSFRRRRRAADPRARSYSVGQHRMNCGRGHTIAQNLAIGWRTGLRRRIAAGGTGRGDFPGGRGRPAHPSRPGADPRPRRRQAACHAQPAPQGRLPPGPFQRGDQPQPRAGLPAAGPTAPSSSSRCRRWNAGPTTSCAAASAS